MEVELETPTVSQSEKALCECACRLVSSLRRIASYQTLPTNATDERYRRAGTRVHNRGGRRRPVGRELPYPDDLRPVCGYRDIT